MLISVPLLMARYLKNVEWPLPLKIKILGIDSESYPGYAIHYAFSFCSIFNGALVIGGKYSEFDSLFSFLLNIEMILFGCEFDPSK